MSYKTPLSALEVSVRTANVLQHEEIRTMGELVMCSDARILRFKNANRKVLRELRALMLSYGLKHPQIHEWAAGPFDGNRWHVLDSSGFTFCGLRPAFLWRPSEEPLGAVCKNCIRVGYGKAWSHRQEPDALAARFDRLVCAERNRLVKDGAVIYISPVMLENLLMFKPRHIRDAGLRLSYRSVTIKVVEPANLGKRPWQFGIEPVRRLQTTT